MGKYDDVIPRLQRLPPEDSKYQELVEEAKRALLRKNAVGADALETYRIQFRSESSADLAALYEELRNHKDRIAEREKVVNLYLEAVSQMLQAAYASEGITNLKLTNGSSVRTQPEPCAKVEDRDALREWCIEEGMERELSLHPKKLESIVKEMVQDGALEVDEHGKATVPVRGVSVWFRPKLVLTRGR